MKNPDNGPDLSLSPNQEHLLRAALSSNPRGSPQTQGNQYNGYSPPKIQATMTNSSDIYTSPTQVTPNDGKVFELDDSPLYDDLDDANFEWDNSAEQLFGDLSGNDFVEDGDIHDKRKASTGSSGGSSKRQEGDDKTPKKPGRKPLTAEPNTKRKAQNRAAQRAFRERKERHLKDLETKVDDLEKVSESTNHENGRLRAQVEKLNTELKEYRKRLSINATAVGHSPPLTAPKRGQFIDNNDFQFAFPKFGDLPGTTFLTNGSLAKTSSSLQSNPTPSVTGTLRKDSSNSAKAFSPTSTNGSISSPSAEALIYQASPVAMGDAAKKFDGLAGLFSPSILESASSRSNSTDYFPAIGNRPTADNVKQRSFSTNSNGAINQKPSRAASASMSPASSLSHGGFDSSVGTTPESSADTPPQQKPNEIALNPISEESTMQYTNGFSNNFQSPPSDFNGIDWLAEQNGGQFDPVLFGDYRDPQDSILNNTFDDFFNNALPTQDFASPYNAGQVTTQEPKRDLMKEIEINQEGEGKEEENCVGFTKLLNRVQNSEKVKSGEADMDDLCSQLKSKAKCSGKGAEIDERDVDKILGPPSSGKEKDEFKMFN